MSAAVLGGLIPLALAPVLAPTAEFAQTSSERFVAMETKLEREPVAQRNRVLAADGSVLAHLYYQNRIEVELSKIAPVMQEAVLAVEDENFYTHNGVDYKALARALVANQSSGEVEQGASTITQQYVKNVLLNDAQSEAEEEAAVEKSVDRKLAEVRYALAVEKTMTKTQILQGYLNIAYFGNGTYGVEAASRYYFNVGADKLTLEQAALLAGLVKNPRDFDPIDQADAALERRGVVLGRMLAAGKITPEQESAASKSELSLKITPVPNGCESSVAPFFCDWVLRELALDPALGKSPKERVARLREGGLVVRTGLMLPRQKAAQKAVSDAVAATERVAMVSVMVEPSTGAVQAMAVNRGFGKGPGKTELALGTAASFQPGSTFKTFTLVAALEAGLSPQHQLYAPERYVSSVFDNPKSGHYSNAEEGESGMMSLAAATRLSVNTYYVPLMEKVGVAKVADTANKMGVRSINTTPENTPNRREGSFTLGTREVSPLDMASAYGTLANRGVHCLPRAVVGINDADGKPLGDHKPECKRVLSAAVADAATGVLQGVIESGTGGNAAIGRAAAGKTGTTQSFGAAWFVGYTPELAHAVWLGDPRGPVHPLVNVLGERRIYGGGVPAKAWSAAMKGALAGVPPKRFAQGVIR